MLFYFRKIKRYLEDAKWIDTYIGPGTVQGLENIILVRDPLEDFLNTLIWQCPFLITCNSLLIIKVQFYMFTVT